MAKSAIDSGLGWTSFQRIALKCTLRNLSAAERRLFDWGHLATLMGAEAKVVLAMSERREITTIDDFRSVHRTTLLQRPLMAERGVSPTIRWCSGTSCFCALLGCVRAPW